MSVVYDLDNSISAYQTEVSALRIALDAALVAESAAKRAYAARCSAGNHAHISRAADLVNGLRASVDYSEKQLARAQAQAKQKESEVSK